MRISVSVGGRPRRLPVVALAALAMFLSASSSAQTGGTIQDRGAPTRRDIVAEFSSGMVVVSIDDHVFRPHVISGELSMSTDDAQCIPSATTPCTYTINMIRLTAEPFAVGDHTLTDVTVVNASHATRQRDYGGGFRLRPLIPFWVRGEESGRMWELYAEHRSPDDFIELAHLVLTPSGGASVFGTLTGSVGGHAVTISLMADAITPFENLPPRAEAGPDQVASTSCIADVVLDSSGTVDPNGDLAATYYSIAGHAIGRGGDSIGFPIGTHDVTLLAHDGHGGLATDHALVTVTDDGGADPLPGTAVVSVAVPRGSRIDDFAILASGDVQLRHDTEVLPGSTPGAIGALGSVVLDVSATGNDAWALESVTLGRNATLRGNVHADGAVTTASGARILGATTSEPLAPPDRVSFYVVLPDTTPADVVVPQRTTVELPAGDHGLLRAMPGATIVLLPGVHTATGIDLMPNSLLAATPGDTPTILAVTGSVRQLGMIGSTTADPALLVVYLGTDAWTASASIHGWVVAPNADLSLATAAAHRSGSDPPFAGAFIARSVTMDNGTQVRHVPLSLDFMRAAHDACAIEPVVNCVRADTAGLHAVFGYRSLLDAFGSTVPIGPFNRVESDLATAPGRVAGQPFAFLPHPRDHVFEVAFSTRAAWTVGGRRAVATEGSPRCP